MTALVIVGVLVFVVLMRLVAEKWELGKISHQRALTFFALIVVGFTAMVAAVLERTTSVG